MPGGDGIQPGLNQLAPGGRLRQQLFKVALPGGRLPVIPDTQATGPHHGRLLAHVRRSGSPRGAHDLITARFVAIADSMAGPQRAENRSL